MSMQDKIEEYFGQPLLEVLEDQMSDSVTTGFCTDLECDGVNECVEPDASGYTCPECGEQTVTSIVELMIGGAF